MKSRKVDKKKEINKKKEVEKKRCIECRKFSDDVRWDSEAGGYVCYKCWLKLYV